MPRHRSCQFKTALKFKASKYIAVAIGSRIRFVSDEELSRS